MYVIVKLIENYTQTIIHSLIFNIKDTCTCMSTFSSVYKLSSLYSLFLSLPFLSYCVHLSIFYSSCLSVVVTMLDQSGHQETNPQQDYWISLASATDSQLQLVCAYEHLNNYYYNNSKHKHCINTCMYMYKSAQCIILYFN